MRTNPRDNAAGFRFARFPSFPVPLSYTLAVLWIGVAAWASSAPAAEDAAAIEKRLGECVRTLASDELEGRGVGTKGLDRAAELVAAQFARGGLKSDLVAGGPYQKFSLTRDVKLGPNNRLALVAPSADPAKPQRIELKLGEDFNPLALGASGSFDLPLVFAGYGITAPSVYYDDYAGLDAAGKALVILRHQPQPGDPKGVFRGANPAQYAPFVRKIANAADHKAAAVVFVDDNFDIVKGVGDAYKRWQQAVDRLADANGGFKKTQNPTIDAIEAQRKRIDELSRQVATLGERLRASEDAVLPIQGAGLNGAGPGLPVVYCRRSVVNRVVQATAGADLAAIEKQIDSGPSPRSQSLDGWRAIGQVDLERVQTEVKNVVAVREGEGPAAEETIVVGAHYDHLGLGRSPAKPSDSPSIFHGADDNASGVAVLVEVARTIGQREEKLGRRVVFAAFACEEMGMVGSQYFVNNPPVPIEKTVAMINLDMVGRLRDDKVSVGGVGSGSSFNALLDDVNRRYGFQLTKSPASLGASDHLSFYNRQVPVMHFFTGLHSDYHRPTDTWDKLNLAGMRRIAGMVAELVVALADAKDPPQFVPPSALGRLLSPSVPQSGGMNTSPSRN